MRPKTPTASTGSLSIQRVLSSCRMTAPAKPPTASPNQSPRAKPLGLDFQSCTVQLYQRIGRVVGRFDEPVIG